MYPIFIYSVCISTDVTRNHKDREKIILDGQPYFSLKQYIALLKSLSDVLNNI